MNTGAWIVIGVSLAIGILGMIGIRRAMKSAIDSLGDDTKIKATTAGKIIQLKTASANRQKEIQNETRDRLLDDARDLLRDDPKPDE